MMAEQRIKKRDKQREVMRARGYITVSEASERTGTGVGTIYSWLESCDVVGERVGKRRYVNVRSLAAYLGPTGAQMLGVQA